MVRLPCTIAAVMFVSACDQMKQMTEEPERSYSDCILRNTNSNAESSSSERVSLCRAKYIRQADGDDLRNSENYVEFSARVEQGWWTDKVTWTIRSPIGRQTIVTHVRARIIFHEKGTDGITSGRTAEQVWDYYDELEPGQEVTHVEDLDHDWDVPTEDIRYFVIAVNYIPLH